MPNSNNTLYLDKFYPEKDLKITDIIYFNKSIRHCEHNMNKIRIEV